MLKAPAFALLCMLRVGLTDTDLVSSTAEATAAGTDVESPVVKSNGSGVTTYVDDSVRLMKDLFGKRNQ